MQSVFVFVDIAKFYDFRRKNADVSRTQGMCHVIYIPFGSSLVRYNFAKFHQRRVCAADFKEGDLFAPLPQL